MTNEKRVFDGKMNGDLERWLGDAAKKVPRTSCAVLGTGV